MSNEIPTGWEPPHKIVGGENNFELCAIRLCDQVTVRMMSKNKNVDLPITRGFGQYVREKDRMIESMKQQGVYFHGPDRSVFIDYKIMREIASKKEGWKNMEAQFSSEMSAEDAMQVARRIVENWNWAKD